MNILITGGNRGLGLELVRQYADAQWGVIATCRHPGEAKELNRLAGEYPNISLEHLDVTRADDVKALGWALRETSLDVLYNNAGVYLEESYAAPLLGRLRYDDWLHSFEVNTLGAARLTESLVERVAAGEKRLVVAMTSHMGSVADIQIPGSYYYRSSKAALNAAMRGLAAELRSRGIGVLLLHPGGVRTRMGPRDGISVEQSVRGIRKLIDGFRMQDTGRFLRYDGTEMPW
jgi:NAD(P)-dependent dehydrogenase (short-subunit alcohol dehydrogenase family)